MRRRLQAKPKRPTVVYTLDTDQGNPDVYVDNVYVGKTYNGRLSWLAEEYDSNKSISLRNAASPPAAETYVGGVAIGSSLGQNFLPGSSVNGIAGGTRTLNNLIEIIAIHERGKTANTSGVLWLGSTSIGLYYGTYSKRLYEYQGENLTVTGASPGANWNGSYTASGYSVTVNYGTVLNSYLRLQFSSSKANYSLDFRVNSL